MLFAQSCADHELVELAHDPLVSDFFSDETLKEAAMFPIGNVWSAGQPNWGIEKGTDLGGPNDDFTRDAYGALSTIFHKQLDPIKENSLLAEQFNSITPEVALKPHNISISPDEIDFSEADAMMAFAEANNIRVHAHVLVFDKSVPEWALEYETNNTWTEQQWENWLENYITTVVGRYSGRIASWDVINEVGIPFGGGLNEDYFWRRVIGPDFIEKAFRWAEAADPDVELFINEFAIGLLPDKLRDIIDLADELRASGCRVDGIGFQGHIVVPLVQADYNRLKSNFKMAADAGYLVHLSELDVTTNLLGITHYQSPLQHRLQRKYYNDIARAYLDGVPQDKRWGITLWNIADKNSFFNATQLWFDLRIFGGPEFPMLWDNNYEMKPAYYGFRNGIKGIHETLFSPGIWDSERIANHTIEIRTAKGMMNESEEMDFYLEASEKLLINHFGIDEHQAEEMIMAIE